jgi:hypothetical protein
MESHVKIGVQRASRGSGGEVERPVISEARAFSLNKGLKDQFEGMSVDEADWELAAAPEGKYLGRGRRDSQVRLPLASKMASSLFRGGLDFWKAFGLPAVPYVVVGPRGNSD